ncbi:hypothetical protein B0O80DRAFT_443350 [Mortierella sp. GBAus27b]|nr:hypothetical protein B0O80DRAFT_443350 [Mortierella sp. GBAus27b]
MCLPNHPMHPARLPARSSLLRPMSQPVHHSSENNRYNPWHQSQPDLPHVAHLAAMRPPQG